MLNKKNMGEKLSTYIKHIYYIPCPSDLDTRSGPSVCYSDGSVTLIRFCNLFSNTESSTFSKYFFIHLLMVIKTILQSKCTCVLKTSCNIWLGNYVLAYNRAVLSCSIKVFLSFLKIYMNMYNVLFRIYIEMESRNAGENSCSWQSHPAVGKVLSLCHTWVWNATGKPFQHNVWTL